MPLASLALGAALPLPLGRLPTPHLPPALGILAVPLVIPPRLKPPTTPLPQTDSPPQSSSTGRDTPAGRKMRTSHGKVRSLGAARGGVASSSGIPLSAHDRARRCRRATLAHVWRSTAEERSPLSRRRDVLRPSPPCLTETKETRKETAQRCAALKERKETNLSKETTRRSTTTDRVSLPAMSVLKLTAFSKPPPGAGARGGRPLKVT